MAIYSFTQAKGGPGTTTLAANLSNVWPRYNRILVELAPSGGTIAWSMGFEALSAPGNPMSDSLAQGGYDFANPSGSPKPLSISEPSEWQLPVLPAPMIPDYPPPGEKMWWQRRAELITSARMDVICDLGVVMPEHLGIHNRVLNASTLIVAVARDLHEARFAAKRLALYHDRLALVVISSLRSLPEEIASETGCACLSVLPRDDAIAENLWRGVLVVEQKKQPKQVKEYSAAVADLADKIAGE